MILTLIATLLLPQPAPDGMARCRDGSFVPTGTACPIVCPWLVYFDQNSAALTAQTEAILEQVVGTFSRVPDSPVLIAGNSDASEDPALSLARVQAIRDYLVTHGLGNMTIKMEAWGNTRPAVETVAGQPEQQNRSVAVGLAE